MQRGLISIVCILAVFPFLAVHSQETETPKQKHLPSPDRTVVRPLEQAKQLIDRNRAADAVALIGTVLEGNDDFFLEPENVTDRTTRKTFKRDAEELLLSLPEEIRQLYALQNEPLAKRLLQNAVEAGSFERVEKIVDSYFYTQAGKDAAFLLAMNQYERGARASALLTFRRLAKEAASLDTYEPTFSLTYAACAKALGRDEETEDILNAFLRRNPNPRLEIGGEEFWNPTTCEEILAKLESWNAVADVAQWIEHSGWLTSSGTADQNPQVNASPPLLELVWKQRTLTQPKLLSMVRLAEGQMRQNKSVFLPTARPVVVGSVLIFRSYEGLVAINMSSGKRLWVGKDYEYKASIFGTNPNVLPFYQPNMSVVQWTLVLLRLNLWHNTTMGSLTSDGRLVFSLEEEPMINFAYGNRPLFLPRGKQIEDPRVKISTTLAARDAQTGEVVWRIGKVNLVQKLLNQIEEQLNEEKQKEEQRQRNANQDQGIPGVVPRVVPRGNRIPPIPGGQGLPRIPVQVPIPDALPIQIQEVLEPLLLEPLPIPPDIIFDFGVKATFSSLIPRLFDTLLLLDAEEPPQETAKTVITPDEQFLGETYFLGAPLPALGNLYALGENAGVIRLFILDAKTGKLVRHIGLIEPQTPIDTDLLRRRLGPTPAYSEGIVVCPTAAGAVCALDATTGKLLWCYTYSDQPKEEDENQRRGGRMGGFGPFGSNLFNFGGNHSDFQNLVDHVGWAIPATIPVDGKLVFAPADRTMLYCFDLLTGELLWKRTKGKGRYIACVTSGKVFVVASDSLVALDLKTGDSLWDDSALAPLPLPQGMSGYPLPNRLNRSTDPFAEVQESPQVATGPRLFFPSGVSPSGVGVRVGNEYMIPMSDQSVVVVDLDTARIVRSWKSLDETRLGHLLAIGGRIISQSATEIACFHQFTALQDRAEKALQTDPNNAEAMLQLGRLAYAQGNRDDAIRFFRQSFASQDKASAQSKAMYRAVLTEAMIADFARYRISLEEIEQLQDSLPDSLVPLLNAYATGCLQMKDYPQFVLAFRQILERDREYRLLHDTHTGNQYLLAEWIAQQIRTYAKEPELATFMESLAQEEFDRIENLERGKAERQWAKFITYFGSHPLATIAWEKRLELLESRKQTTEMEMLAAIAHGDLLPRLGGPPISKEAEQQSLANPGDRQSSMFLRNEMNDPQSQLSLDWQRAAAKDKFRILLNSGTLRSESAEVVDVADVPEVVSQEHDPNAALLAKLARSLENAGHFQSALFYYRLLGTLYADTSLSADDSDTTKTGTAIYETALENPAYQPFAFAKTWPKGFPDELEVDKSEQAEKFRDECLAEMQNPLVGYSGRQASTSIPFGSMVSPFFGNSEFTLLSDPNSGMSIICRDVSGQRQWTVEIPQDVPDDVDSLAVNQFQVFGNMSYDYYAYNASHSGCLIAYRHLLYYLRGKRIVAIDTLKRDKSGTPAILWTRTNQSPLAGIRLFRTAVNISSVYSNQGHPFVHPLFVNTKVLCFQDLDTLYGVDPLTGELLWTRDSLSFQSYLTGDEECVYQLRTVGEQNVTGNRRGNFLSEIFHEAIAIDPATGKETASGKLPSGIFHGFDSMIVCSKVVRPETAEMCFEVYDLKEFLTPSQPKELLPEQKESGEMEKSELRAKALSIGTQGIASNVAGPGISVQPLFRSKPLAMQAIFNITENGRILAIVTQAEELQVYDLASRQTLVSSIRLPVAQENTNQPFRQNGDFYLEFDGDEFLILLITDNNLNTNTFVGNSDSGRRATNNRTFLPGYPQRGVGRGQVMRYDKTGKPMWDKAVEIKNWQFLEAPKASPVLLFGALVINEGGRRPLNSPAVSGINKKTGTLEFSKRFESDPASRSPQQYVKVFIDAMSDTLIFLSAESTYRGRFGE